MTISPKTTFRPRVLHSTIYTVFIFVHKFLSSIHLVRYEKTDLSSHNNLEMRMQSIKESCFCLMATLSPNIISKWFIYSQEIQLHRSLFKLYKLQWKFKQLTSNIGKCKHTRWSQVYFQSLKLRWETQGKPGFCITINQAIKQSNKLSFICNQAFCF